MQAKLVVLLVSGFSIFKLKGPFSTMILMEKQLSKYKLPENTLTSFRKRPGGSRESNNPSNTLYTC